MHHPISITHSPAVQETLDRMLEFSGPQFPDDICGKKAMADAATVIELLRNQIETLCAAADSMREATNWLPVVFGECDSPDGVYVPTTEEAIAKYSDASRLLERATHYARKASAKSIAA